MALATSVTLLSCFISVSLVFACLLLQCMTFGEVLQCMTVGW